MVAAEKATIEKRAELDARKLELRLEQAETEVEASAALQEREIGLTAQRQKVANDISDEHLRLRLIERLPELLAQMPKPEEQRNISIRSDDSMTAVVGGIMEIIDRVRARD
jgi:hypothetical protein